MIDSGSPSELILQKEALNKILQNVEIVWQRKTKKLLLYQSEKDMESANQYMLSSIKMNEKQIQDMQVEEEIYRPYSTIGIQFFNKFDSIYIDTANKIFYFYK